MWPDSVTTDDCPVDLIMPNAASGLADSRAFALTIV